MKLLKQNLKILLLLLITTFLISCGDDDDNGYNTSADGPKPTGNTKVYNLGSVADASIKGTATFLELNDNSITLELDLQNTPSGGEHPAHIHFNTVAETGGVAESLTPVDGSTGKSSTNFSSLDDGSPITYDEILGFDGYINIHLSASDLSTLVAQGDIGQNELTGVTKTYDLNEADVSGINGIAEFAERVNGTTLVTISLNGTQTGNSHPAHIHQNDVATGGNIIAGLNPISGDTGISETQISELVGGDAVSFDDFLTIDAYINVHLSDTEMNTIVSEGNIGANEGSTDGNATNFDVSNGGASAYVFNDGGFTNANNPDLTLVRGETYIFTINSPGHPFYIKSSQGNGTSNAYNSNVTNNGTADGTITFTVPDDAPDTLFYNCQFHGAMTGTITITD